PRGAWMAILAAAVPSVCLAEASRPSVGAQDRLQERLAEARALQQKGSLREAQRSFEALLPDLRARSDRADLGATLNALSQMGTAQGDYDRAAATGLEAAELYRNLADRSGERRAVNNIGLAELYRGDYPPAVRHFEEALALARST